MFKAYPLCSTVDECLYSKKSSYDYESYWNMTTPAGFAMPLYNTTTGITDNLTNSSVQNKLPSDSSGLDVIDGTPNTALLTFMLTLFTFVIAYMLKGLRNKKVLGRTVSGSRLNQKKAYNKNQK